MGSCIPASLFNLATKFALLTLCDWHSAGPVVAVILQGPQGFNCKRIGYTDQLLPLSHLRDVFAKVTGCKPSFRELPPPKPVQLDCPNSPDMLDILAWHRYCSIALCKHCHCTWHCGPLTNPLMRRDYGFYGELVGSSHDVEAQSLCSEQFMTFESWLRQSTWTSQFTG